MNVKTIIGIILIGLGIVSFAYQGISYTSKEKVVDFGPIQATAETKKNIPLPPVAGAIFLIGGIFLVFSARKA